LTQHRYELFCLHRKCFGEKVKNVVTAAAIFRFSYSKFRRTADLPIAFWKKQIELCPNINDNNKEWGKEFIETMVKKEWEKLELKFKEVMYRCIGFNAIFYHFLFI